MYTPIGEVEKLKAQPRDTPTATLARFAAEMRPGAIPDDVVHQAKRLLLDTVGCMLGGGMSHSGYLGARWATQSGIAGYAGVAGRGGLTTPTLAAYANGRLGAAIDADEVFPSARQTSHLAVATVAAALATAERRRGSGMELLTAIVAGYEVGARISSAMIPRIAGPSQGLQAGWGPGSVLGATAAAGKAAALSATAMAHAFGISGMHIDPAPLKWAVARPSPMIKSADAGWHAMTAVAAVEMVDLGMTGFNTILDGETGLWKALGYEACDFSEMTAELGERWLIMDSGLKAWPCQYWMHPAATALWMLLRDNHVIRPHDIRKIVLFTNEKSFSAKFHDRHPPGEVDRAFSFPHVASMLVLNIPIGPGWFGDDIAQSLEATALREFVEVRLHPDADRFLEWVVDHQIRDMPAAAVVHTGASTFEASTRFGLGSPWSKNMRLTDGALVAKFRSLAEPLRAADRTWSAALDGAVDWMMQADQMPDVTALQRLISPADPL